MGVERAANQRARPDERRQAVDKGVKRLLVLGGLRRLEDIDEFDTQLEETITSFTQLGAYTPSALVGCAERKLA